MYKNKFAFRYFKMLLPAILVAVFVSCAICIYKAPKMPAAGAGPVQKASAKAKMPDLKIKKQKEGGKKEMPSAPPAALSKFDESGTYKDGKYTGSAKGFGGMITVSVTIRKNRIYSVKILSAPGEDAAYFGRARSLTGTIVKKQSANVDAVSGATYSSNGIINAVRNALAKAKKGKNTKEPEANVKNEKTKLEKKVKKPKAVTGGNWADGIYQGFGEGFGGTLKVSVVIKDGRIKSVTIIASEDDRNYLDKASRQLLPGIVKKQGTNVDTVSGATYSSAGILQAVNDALSKAAAKNRHKKKDSSGKDTPQKSKPASDQDDPESAGGDGGQTAVKTTQVTKTVKVYCDDDEDFEDYDMSVTFTIKDNKIIAVARPSQLVAVKDNEGFIVSAWRGITGQLKSKPAFQGIDTVSGATCTSLAIIQAGQQALQ